MAGEATTTGQTLYNTWSYGPRLGFAFDMTGKGTSVIRGYYGKLYDGAVFSSWSRAVPGLTPNLRYLYDSEAQAYYLDSSTEKQYTVDTNNIKQPEVTEWNASWEQQFMKQFKLTITGIARDWHNFVNSVIPDATWSTQSQTVSLWPTASGIPSPVAGITTVPYYAWTNPASVPQLLIQNTDTVTYNIDGSPVTATGARRYRGLMFVLERAQKNRWQAQFSWVISKTEGTISNSTYAGIASGQFETPNGILVNSGGNTAYDRRHMVRLFAGYQIPKIEVSVNGYWRYESGWPTAPYYRISASKTELDIHDQPEHGAAWRLALHAAVLYADRHAAREGVQLRRQPVRPLLRPDERVQPELDPGSDHAVPVFDVDQSASPASRRPCT